MSLSDTSIRGECFYLFGDHEESEHWIEAHRDLTPVVSKETKEIRFIQSVPATNAPTVKYSLNPAALTSIETAEKKLFEPIKDRVDDAVECPEFKSAILYWDHFTDENEINDILLKNSFSFPKISDLILSALISLKRGDVKGAIATFDLHQNKAELCENLGSERIEKAASSDANSGNILLVSQENIGLVNQMFVSGKFIDWLLYLDPSQKPIVDEDVDMPAVLNGVAGSGKTSIIVHRALRLAHQYPNERIAIVTLNRNLAHLISRLAAHKGQSPNLRSYCIYDLYKKILKIADVEPFLRDFATAANQGEDVTNAIHAAKNFCNQITVPVTPRERRYIFHNISEAWINFWDAHVNFDFREGEFKRSIERRLNKKGLNLSSYLKQETDLIRSTFSIQTRKDYLRYKRRGRLIKFNNRERVQILDLTVRYEVWLLLHHISDELFLTQAVIHAIERLSVDGNGLTHECKFRSLLVDEYQDLSTLDFKIMKALCYREENSLFLAGDPWQQVFVKDGKLYNAGLGRKGRRTFTLKKNYRNPKRVLESSSRLLDAYPELKEDDEIELLSPEHATAEGDYPEIINSDNPITEAWSIANQWFEHDPQSNVAILHPSQNQAIISEILEGNPYPDAINGLELSENFLNIDKPVVVSDFQSAKGFEFGCVILIDLNEGICPDPNQIEEWRDALKLYVAMTRCRNRLYLISDQKKPASRFLKIIKPEAN